MYSNISKIVVVTGATGGLGYSVIRKFVYKEFNLVAIGRNKKKLNDLKSKIKRVSSEVKILTIKCDIRSETDIKKAVGQIEEAFSKIDILINNVGVRIASTIEDMSINDWENVIKTNLTGLFFLTKYALPLLKKSVKSTIINISSVRGLYGDKNLSAYSASKFGVIGFTQSLAEELKNDGIKVYSICPAAMDTDMIRNVRHNIQREELIQPEEMAEIIFNISSKRQEPTGKTIVVAGKQVNCIPKIKDSKDYKIIKWK